MLQAQCAPFITRRVDERKENALARYTLARALTTAEPNCLVLVLLAGVLNELVGKQVVQVDAVADDFLVKVKVLQV